MATTNKQTREQRRRSREYEARVAVNEVQVARRRRDNLIAIVSIVAVAVLAGLSQFVFATSGPGSPAATPAAAEPTATSQPSASPSPAVSVPDPAIAQARTWTGTLTLNGTIPLGIELDGAAAPQAVANFISLNEQAYFDGTACHRLTTEGIFVLQCGDPTGTGTGDPGYEWGPIENAPVDDVYPAGTIAMARQGGNASSMGSQFFIVYADSVIPSDSAGGYTVLGRVTSGLDGLTTGITSAGVVGGGADGAPAAPATITAISLQ